MNALLQHRVLVSQVKDDGGIAMERTVLGDITDRQWHVLRKMVPEKLGTLMRSTLDRGVVLNAILCVVRTGCQWLRYAAGVSPVEVGPCGILAVEKIRFGKSDSRRVAPTLP